MKLENLKKSELIKEYKKIQNELYNFREEYIFEDIDYIKKINKLEEENNLLRLKLNEITKIVSPFQNQFLDD